jgi:hypothetical protein
MSISNSTQHALVEPEVCLHEKTVTIPCAHCEVLFTPNSPRHRFHTDSCRVAAHRAPAKALTLARRNTRFKRLNHDRSLSGRGYGGPFVSGVPPARDIEIVG